MLNLEDTLPIYIFGDSHVLPLGDRIFRDPWTRKWVATKTKYISGLTAHDFFNLKNDSFHPEFIDALSYEGLIRNGKAAHLSTEEMDFHIAKATGQPLTSPLISLVMGDIDIRLIFLPMLKDKFDFLPPFETPYPSSKKSLLMWDILEETMKKHINPYIQGIQKLKNAGFNRIYVQLVSPPTMDEHNFEWRHGYHCPFDVRYKVTFAFNKLLSEECKKNNVNIIDIWPKVTKENYLNPDYELDGVHLPPVAAFLNVSAILEHAINHQWEAVNYVRHELFYRMACNEENIFDHPSLSQSNEASLKNQIKPARNVPPTICTEKASKTIGQHSHQWIDKAVAEFKSNGICILKTDPGIAQKWRENLIFDRDVGNRHSAWDWAGNSIAPYSDVLSTCLPPQLMIDELKALLDQPEYDEFFRSIVGCSMTVMNCRPVRSRPHNSEGIGPQSWHEDGCPAGIIRGVLYLSDVDEQSGPFQYKRPDDSHTTVTGKMGDFLIFDAMRLRHRALPPEKNIRTALDFVFMPRLSSDPFAINVSGMNHWPADPFCYTMPTDKTDLHQVSNTELLEQKNIITNDKQMFAAECHRLRSELIKLQNSKSWRMTAFLRSIMQTVHVFKKKFITT